MSNFRRFFIFSIVVAFLGCPLGAAASDTGNSEIQMLGYDRTDPMAMLVDLVATRPLGAASIATGTATFVVSLPFSLLGGNTTTAFKELIVYPTKYTFLRSLGDI